MKKRDIMKNLVLIHILCLLFLIACANNTNQIPESLSSSYDGIWDGYAQTPEYIINSYGDAARAPERLYIKAEIKNGIVSGSVEDTKINGYITSDNKLFTDPIYAYIGIVSGYGPPDKINTETTLMSLNKIEGTWCIAQVAKAPKYNWFIVKPATGKSDTINSIVQSDILISNIRLRNLSFQNNSWDFLYEGSHE
jgi:hypothetical protein